MHSDRTILMFMPLTIVYDRTNNCVDLFQHACAEMNVKIVPPMPQLLLQYSVL